MATWVAMLRTGAVRNICVFQENVTINLQLENDAHRPGAPARLRDLA